MSGNQHEQAVAQKPKSGMAIAIIAGSAAVILAALALIIKLSQIFHWWMTLPW